MQTLNNKRKMASVSNLKNKIKCLFISNKRRRELRVMANKFHQMILVVVLSMFTSIFCNNNKIKTKLFILHRLMLLPIMLKNIRKEPTRQKVHNKRHRTNFVLMAAQSKILIIIL